MFNFCPKAAYIYFVNSINQSSLFLFSDSTLNKFDIIFKKITRYLCILYTHFDFFNLMNTSLCLLRNADLDDITLFQ